MKPYEFLLPIYLSKVYKLWVFPALVCVWPSKQFLVFSQFIWPSDVLNIQNQSNLSYFEAILPLKLFLLKIWQSV
jgi:hypothetical protein